MLSEENKRNFNDYRPVLHYSVPSAWLNDPNGLIRYKGYYHLYYQFYPGGMEHGTMYWGHARSRDLICWEECGTAIEPDENGEIFSGCTVYDPYNRSCLGQKHEGTLTAIFTQHRKDEEGNVIQVQSIAVSRDDGNSFEKYKNNPILTDGAGDFRDPKIFYYEAGNKYIMALAKGLSVCFYDSGDLIHWHFLSTFKENQGKKENVWECPDLLCFTTQEGIQKWVLIFSVSTKGHEKDGMVYYTGVFNGVEFVPDEGSRRRILDFGSDHYAAVTFADTGDRKLLLGWMNNWQYAHRIPAVTFRGNMTFPRELKLKETFGGYRLYQRPVPELDSVLSQTVCLQQYQGVLPLAGNPCMIKIKTTKPGLQVEIKNNNNCFKVCISHDRRNVSLDRRMCVPRLGGEELDLRKGDVENEVEELMILLDTNSVEVFVNGGETAGTMLCFWAEPYEQINLSEEAEAIEIFETHL